LKEIEALQRRLEREKAALTQNVAAMRPITYKIPRGGIKRLRGAQYSTWFKAMGAFKAGRMGESPTLMLEMDELGFDVPDVFYSQAITGRVKFDGIVSLEYVINHLNSRAPWDGEDFRDIYPRWEYTYRIVESIGGVPVRFYEKRGKQPRNKKDRMDGFDGR